MGYITSATTEYLDLHMTERGRKLLLQGSLADNIIKFALSDLDKDYRNANNLTSGFVPGVTGSHNNCIFGVNNGYDLRDKITYLDTPGNQLLKQSTQLNQMMAGVKVLGSSTYQWTNNIDITYYVHDHLALLRAAAFNLIGNHNWEGINRTTFSSYFTNITDPSNKAWSLNIDGLWDSLNSQGRSIDVDIISKLFQQTKGATKATQVKLNLVGGTERIFPKVFGGVYLAQGLPGSKENTDKGPERGIKRQALTTISPFSLTNNTFVDENKSIYAGAGAMGVSFGSFVDFGYWFGSMVENVPYYPQYGIESNVGGFYNISQVHNKSFNSRFIEGNALKLDTLVPAARFLIPTNPETNLYSVLQPNQLNTNTTLNFKSNSLVGRLNNDSSSTLPTYAQFLAGTSTYTLKSGGRNYPKILNKNHPNLGMEPNTMLARLVEQVVNYFETLTKDPDTSSIVTKVGSGVTAKYTIPLNFQATSNTDTKVKSANISLKLVLDCNLLYQNYTYVAPTASSSATWLVYDETKPTCLFFGDGTGGSTTNPTDTMTSGGRPTFVEQIT